MRSEKLYIVTVDELFDVGWQNWVRLEIKDLPELSSRLAEYSTTSSAAAATPSVLFFYVDDKKQPPTERVAQIYPLG